jgi:magnesium chelatase family protein
MLLVCFRSCDVPKIKKRLNTILPDLIFYEALEVRRIYSVGSAAGHEADVHYRPFRAPYHTISDAMLVGAVLIRNSGE